MTSRMILFFCLSVIAFQARADWVISPTVAPDSEYKERTTALDEQEPDTLFYDDSGPNFSIGSIANYYAYVRFTPPADFQLRSIYVGVGDTAGTAVPCSLWVHLPNGSRPGIELAAVEIELQAGHAIYDITLDEPLDFSGGQDFMVVIGRSPGRTGWSPLLDGGSTVNRSYVTLENRTMGFYQAIPYDFRIRAGGSFNMYVDASAEECFNQVNHGASAYHVRAGDSVLFKTRIANLGDVPISSCELHWIVYDGMDNEIWSNTIELFDLDPDSQRTAAAASAFVPAEAGEYLCLCRIRADEDADSANNTALLRMFAAQNPAWYHYDDMSLS